MTLAVSLAALGSPATKVEGQMETGEGSVWMNPFYGNSAFGNLSVSSPICSRTAASFVRAVRYVLAQHAAVRPRHAWCFVPPSREDQYEKMCSDAATLMPGRSLEHWSGVRRGLTRGLQASKWSAPFSFRLFDRHGNLENIGAPCKEATVLRAAVLDRVGGYPGLVPPDS